MCACVFLQLRFLLQWGLENLEEAALHTGAITLLRAIIGRRIVVPEVYDVITRLQEAMVRVQVCIILLLAILHRKRRRLFHSPPACISSQKRPVPAGVLPHVWRAPSGSCADAEKRTCIWLPWGGNSSMRTGAPLSIPLKKPRLIEAAGALENGSDKGAGARSSDGG